MATWLADRAAGDRLGRRRRAATAGSTGVASVVPSRFCTTPPIDEQDATMNDSGSRTRSVVRVRSTQKLPSVRCPGG